MSNLLPVLKRLDAKMDDLQKKLDILIDCQKVVATIQGRSEQLLTLPPKFIAGKVTIDDRPIRKKRTANSGN